MSYIEREALREEIESLSVTLCGKELFGELAKHSVVQKINEAPTADVEEVRHGEWRDRYDEKYANRLYECSLCGEVAPDGTVYDELERPLRQQILSPYCPRCGAKMDGERREE